MRKFLFIFFIFTNVSALDLFVIYPSEKEKLIHEEDLKMVIKKLNECEYLKNNYPKQYKRLDNDYTIVQNHKDKKLDDTYLCGEFIAPIKFIFIYPKAFISDGCYKKDYKAVFAHEVLHFIGLPVHAKYENEDEYFEKDEIEKAVYECYLKHRVF